MSKHLRLFCLMVAMLYCTDQLKAQEFVSGPAGIRRGLQVSGGQHGGLQAYRPGRKWKGLDLAAFFGTDNTVTGVQALNNCTTCDYDVADGYQTLYSCTTCNFNTADGAEALYSCTTCYYNNASGSY